MKTKKRAFTLFLTLMICLLPLADCSGRDEREPAENTSTAKSADADTSVTEDETLSVREDLSSDAPNETRTPPDIKSTDLTGFSLSFGNPEESGSGDSFPGRERAMYKASYSFVIKTADPEDLSSAVTCSIDAKPYDADEDEEPLHVSIPADISDLQALQTQIEKHGLIETSCNFTDGLDDFEDDTFVSLTLLYASGESAYHYNHTTCDIGASRLFVFSFFYDLLDKYNLPFYYHPVTYTDEDAFMDEEAFIEAFMGQAPWDELTVTADDGTQTKLSLSSDPTGRVFRLSAGEDVYAGSYKFKKREDDGRWRLDLTLTLWPAAYTPMTKGGSILIDTEVGDADNGTETLVISKYPNTASIFDAYFGEEDSLVFTRKRTEYFDAKPFATAQTEDASDEGDTE